MARRYPYDTSPAALLRPAHGARFLEAWTDRDTAAPDLLCAEMARLAYAAEPVVRWSLARIGFARRHPGPLIVTGHGLGGALATLAAAEHSGACAHARDLRLAAGRRWSVPPPFRGLEVRRVVHCCDIVSRVLPERIDAATPFRLAAPSATSPASRERRSDRFDDETGV